MKLTAERPGVGTDDVSRLKHLIRFERFRARAEAQEVGPAAPLAELRPHAPSVSVVVPALNEARNLPYVLPSIDRFADEVILVDGGSNDSTSEVARSLIPSIVIVDQQSRGKGAALREGFDAATGDIIVMLDADGSTDPTEIPLFVGALLAGADFAKGSRFLQGAGSSDISRFRSLGNRGLMVLVRILFGGRYSDLCYGYNAFWRDVVPVLALDGDGFEIETMMNVRALNRGLRVAEVPSFEHGRIHGVSNLRAIPDGFRVLRTIVRERASRPVRRRAALPSSRVGADIPDLDLRAELDERRRGATLRVGAERQPDSVPD